MATISGFSSSVCTISRVHSQKPSQSSKISLGFLQIRNTVSILHGNNPNLAEPVRNNNKKKLQRWQMVPRSVAEETQIPEETAEASTADQPVSVPVSPSDVLTMLFQAEGTLNETAIPAVTGALQEAEGISNLKVQVIEGIASVELTKQTTVQATGVASSLVEIIQSSGFKLQTLNLSFEDEEDAN